MSGNNEAVSALRSSRAGGGDAPWRLHGAVAPVLIVTGSPGVGKTTVARALAERLPRSVTSNRMSSSASFAPARSSPGRPSRMRPPTPCLDLGGKSPAQAVDLLEQRLIDGRLAIAAERPSR